MAFWYQRQKWRNWRNRNRYQLSPPARRREEQLPTTRHFHRQSAGGWGGNSVRAFLTRALNQPMGSKDHSREFLELGQIISCRNLQSLEEIKGLPICEHTSTPLPASTQWTHPETNHVPPPHGQRASPRFLKWRLSLWWRNSRRDMGSNSNTTKRQTIFQNKIMPFLANLQLGRINHSMLLSKRITTRDDFSGQLHD